MRLPSVLILRLRRFPEVGRTGLHQEDSRYPAPAAARSGCVGWPGSDIFVCVVPLKSLEFCIVPVRF